MLRGVKLEARVDVSQSSGHVPTAQLDRRRAFVAATRAIGHADILSVVDGVCCAGHSISALAAILVEPRDVVVKLLKIGLDNLAVHYGLAAGRRTI